MKKGSFFIPYNTKIDESNDIFQLVYKAISDNDILVIDSDKFLINDYLDHEKRVLIENADYYLSYTQDTKSKITNSGDNVSKLPSVLDIKNATTSDKIYSFTKSIQISKLFNKMHQKRKM